ncbi:hypothetical protein RRG08_016058 [Elysia crispata]|uniref:Uncharacterized protein n=1 Tax=Elysia crispata TaxID=231223 RepID=A0AAE0ZNT5_9GAST|nr:hypothetical protein RRG08_016058 [Elysia crispata]
MNLSMSHELKRKRFNCLIRRGGVNTRHSKSCLVGARVAFSFCLRGVEKGVEELEKWARCFPYRIHGSVSYPPSSKVSRTGFTLVCLILPARMFLVQDPPEFLLIAQPQCFPRRTHLIKSCSLSPNVSHKGST